MTYQSRLARLVLIIVVAACAGGGSTLVSGAEKAPAGQMCPTGSYVIGFDSESNIICSNDADKNILEASDTSDINVAATAETCMGGDCQSGDPAKQGTAEEIAGKTATATQDAAPSVTMPGISKVKPSSVVFGTRKIEITISGTGFSEDSIVVFTGKKFTPSVNQAGTQLLVTIPSRDLSIGPYAITVSNGPGMETTLKKALRVY